MHRKRSFKYLVNMQTILFLMIIILVIMGSNGHTQNYAEGIPSEVFEAIQNALPNEGDVFPGYNWELHGLTITKEINPGNDSYIVGWRGENPRGSSSMGHHDAYISCNISAFYSDISGDKGPYYEISVPDTQRWDVLPGAYKKYDTRSDGSSYCRILFWNLDGSILVSLWVSGNSDIVCPEAERLAKLVFSRLPEKFYSLKSGKPFSVPGFDQPGSSSGLPSEQAGSDTAFPGAPGSPTGPGLSGPGSEGPISDAALPLAVGAAALVTALGTLGLAYSGGTTPAEAFGELKTFLTPNRAEAPAPPADNRDPQAILEDPRLHDKVTDTDGKQWVYYRRPGDIAGDGWTSLDQYNQTLTQEQQGNTYSERWGWSSEKEQQNYEANLEKQRAADQLEKETRRAEEARQKDQAQAQRKALEAEKAKLKAEEAALAREKIAAGEQGYQKAMQDYRYYDNLHFGAQYTVKACDYALDKMADIVNAGNAYGPGTKVKILYRSLRDAGTAVAEVYAKGKGSYKKAFLVGAGKGAYDSLAEIIAGRPEIKDASRSVKLLFNTAKETIKEATIGDGNYETALAAGLTDTYADAAFDSLNELIGPGADVVKINYDLTKDYVTDMYNN